MERSQRLEDPTGCLQHHHGLRLSSSGRSGYSGALIRCFVTLCLEGRRMKIEGANDYLFDVH